MKSGDREVLSLFLDWPGIMFPIMVGAIAIVALITGADWALSLIGERW